jgi:hypothetical protein
MTFGMALSGSEDVEGVRSTGTSGVVVTVSAARSGR